MKKITALILTAALLLTGVCLAEDSFICHNCGYFCWGGSFCDTCGARRPSGIYECPFCNTYFDSPLETETFCPNCGTTFLDVLSANEPKDESIGRMVTFGTYPQTAAGNDNTPIEWIVLDRDGDEYLLISKMILDCHSYYPEYADVAWENSTLRAWLNNEFYNRAFNASQKSQIVSTTIEAEEYPDWGHLTCGNDTIDNVFLLSDYGKYYAWKYLTYGDNSILHATEYAYSRSDNHSFTDEYGNHCMSMWILGYYYRSNATFIDQDGMCSWTPEYDFVGVRPCIWVRLDASAAGNSAAQSVNSSADDSWTCPGCGNVCTAGKFCNECGTKKPDDVWTCSNCGNVMTIGNFCTECGTKISTDVVTAEQMSRPVQTVVSQGNTNYKNGTAISSNLIGKPLQVQDKVGGWFQFTAPEAGDYSFYVYAPYLTCSGFSIQVRGENRGFEALRFVQSSEVQVGIVKNLEKDETIYWWDCNNDNTNYTMLDPFVLMIKYENTAATDTSSSGLDFSGCDIGDIVTFGTYPQTAGGNDDTPIEWIILDKRDDEYLLISKLALDYQQYNIEHSIVTWETCTLREWLNGDFYNKAFSASEKSRIISSQVKADIDFCSPEEYMVKGNDTIDKVFIPSITGLYEYSWNIWEECYCYATEFAEAMYIAEMNEKYGEGVYTRRNDSDGYYCVSRTDAGGHDICLFGRGEASKIYGSVENRNMVRPEIWVKGEEKISSNYTAAPKSTPTLQPTNTPKPTATPRKSTAAPKSTKNAYGTLKIDAGTNIRGSAATNGSLVMTTNRQMTFKYVSCENGWYKIILDDGSYAYVYYTRATVTEQAPGDDGSYGIKPTSGGSGSSGGNGSGGSGSGGGGMGGGGNTHYDASCSDPDISKHKLIYRGQKMKYGCVDLEWHLKEYYNYYCCSCGKHTFEEWDHSDNEWCTWVNGRCSKCGGQKPPSL